VATSFEKNDKSAKSTKADRSSRRAIADDVRRSQSRAEARKSFLMIGVFALVALLIVGAAAFKPLSDWWQMRQYADQAVADIGAPATACQPITTKAAKGEQQHLPDGTPIPYEDAPPAFGPHYNIPATMERKLYTDDRPDLGTLVHNLEHGYTILWYDDSIAQNDDAMVQLRALADKFAGTENFRNKFIAVPWTSEDGKSFPEGQHVALTHWAARDITKGAKEGAKADATQGSVGVWQYCSAVSGAALDQFMLDWDYTNSPEPDAM
jgi:hypothetical protein